MIFLILGPLFLAGGIYFLVAGGILKMISYTFIPLGVVFTGMGVMFRRSRGRRTKLMQSGLPGTATIRSLQQTSMMVNNEPVINLSVYVEPEGRQPFEATVRTAVSMVTLSQVDLKPGAKLPVKVNPDKANDFIIDWNGAVMQRAAAAQAPV
jgi:hypothetical protein